MKIVDIPKGNGRFRRIYVPSKRQRRELRVLVPKIADRARKATPPHVRPFVHGIQGTNAVTAAEAHVGHRWTICFDLESCFDHVTSKKLLAQKLPEEIVQKVTVDGAARQGLPTSPACANLALVPLDVAITRAAKKKHKQIIYTRYVDDLTVSGDNPDALEWAKAQIPKIVRQCGWKLAEHKTRVQYASTGRRIVCGVAVGEDRVYPTRKAKRRLRAAQHQENESQANGLSEWCQMKRPRERTRAAFDDTNAFAAMARFWKLSRVSADKLPDKGDDVDLGDGCYITGDPVMMLGMSTWTNGWTSCMSHPRGQYRRGTVFWSHLRGTRVAYLASGTVTVNKITRPKMAARALVHELRDSGILVYDRVYGGDVAARKLAERLRSHGAIPFTTAREKHKGEKVVGHAPASWKSYFDNLKHSIAVASNGPWKGRKVRTCHV